MTKKDLDYNFKYRLVLIVLFALSVSTPLIDWVGYTEPSIIIKLLFSLALTLFYTLCYFIPAISMSIPVLLGLVAALYSFDHPLIVKWVLQIFSTPQPVDAPFWPLVIVALITLLFFILVKLRAAAGILFPLGLIYFLLLWYHHVDSAYISLITYSISWLLLYSNQKGALLWELFPYRNRKSEDIIDFRNNWSSYTISVIIISLLVTLILPKDFAPLPLYSFHRWVNETFPYFERLRGVDTTVPRGDGEEFSFYSFGGQEGILLGGPLIQDDRVLLEVKGASGLYLKGNIQDFYTGNSWEKSDTAVALSSYPSPPKVLEGYLEEVEIEIKHVNLRTKSIFSMPYPIEISTLPGFILIDHNGTIILSNSIPRNYTYKIKGNVLAGNPDFSSLEKAYNLKNYDKYLQLPSEFPPAVRRLARDIAGNHNSYYDKMKALETYLRTNYYYNTEVPSIPSNYDFSEYFLFESREGYCTYFSTALAVMGRSIGVPTRLVTGFAVPYSRSDTVIQELSGLNAHAWVEAYIPGVGWIPFEATPGFRMYTSRIEFGETDYDYLQGLEALDEDSGMSIDESDIEHFFADVFITDDQDEKFNLDRLFGFMYRMVMYGALIIILLSTLYILYRYIKLRSILKIIKRQPYYLQVANYYVLILYLLEKTALGITPGETPLNYCSRIIGKVHSFTINFKDLSEGVNLALYSKELVGESVANNAEIFLQDVFERYLAQNGYIKAYLDILLHSRQITGLIII